MATAAKVLIVDHEPLVVDVCSRMLGRRGYDVLSTDQPLQALEIVRNYQSVDLVLSELLAPQMRGTDLVYQIEEVSPTTRFVLMTAGVSDCSEKPPGVPLLYKPISLHDLIAAVEQALARSAELKATLREATKRCAELQTQAYRLVAECLDASRSLAKTVEQSRLIRES